MHGCSTHAQARTLVSAQVWLAQDALLHLLAAASQHAGLCQRLADPSMNLFSVLPLIRVLAPAIKIASIGTQPPDYTKDANRPEGSTHEPVEVLAGVGGVASGPRSGTSQYVMEKVLALMVTLTTDARYKELCSAVMPYLANGGESQEKAACILLDLACSSMSEYVTHIVPYTPVLIRLLERTVHVLNSKDSASKPGVALILLMRLVVTGRVDGVLAQLVDKPESVLFLVELMARPIAAMLATTTSALTAETELSGTFAVHVLHEAVSNTQLLFSVR